MDEVSFDKVVDDYKDRFEGLGKMKGVQVKLNINEDVKSIAQKKRSISFHLRDQVDREIERLKDLGLLEDSEGPSPWVSPIVVVRERYPLNTIEDLIADMNGSKIFSKIDLNTGYHQLELAPEIRYITTYATHKALSLGIHFAAELFLKASADMLVGIPGVKNISDDIILYSQSVEEHMEIVKKLHQYLRVCNAPANTGKS